MMVDLRFDFYDPDTSVTTPLVFDPIGWNENLAKFERSSKYWSVFLSVTLPLKFVDEDAELIRGYYYTKGIGSKLQLKIYERNIFTNLFELAYLGRFDFSTMNDQIDFIEVALVDDGLIKTFQLNENTKYDVEIPTTNALEFSGLAGWFEKSVQLSSIYDNEVPVIDSVKLRIEMDDYRHNNYQGVIAYRFRPADGYNIVAQSPCKVKLNTTGTSRKVIYSNITSAPGNVSIRIYERVYKYDDSTGTEILLATLSTTTHTFTVTNPPDLEIDLPYINADLTAGEIELDTSDMIGIFVELESITDVTSGDLRYICEVGSITQTLSIYAPLPADTFNVISPKDLFSGLIEKMSPGTTVQSDFLDSISGIDTDRFIALFTPKNVFTYYVDGVEQKQDYFSTSINDFYKWLWNIGYCVGISITETTVRLEALSFFINNSLEVLDFGTVKDLSIENANEFIPSTIKHGFNNYSYDNSFGLQEPFTNWMVKTPNEVLQSDADWIENNYRMDMTGFDNCRKLNLDMWFNGATNGLSIVNVVGDVEGVNDIYAMDCEFTETISSVNYFELKRGEVTVVNTDFINADTAYNLEFTPRRNLERKRTYIDSIFYFFDGLDLENTSAGKYPYLTTEKNSVQLAEGTWYEIANDSLYFYPIFANFSAAITEEIGQSLMLNRNKIAKFTGFGSTFYGFLWSLDRNYSQENESTVKVLLTTTNNLLNFVR